MHMMKCDSCGTLAKTEHWNVPKGWRTASGAKLEHLCRKCSRVVNAAIQAAVKKIGNP